MTVWNKKTNRGRVVYDRKPHTWTIKDYNRVADAILVDMAGTSALQRFLEDASIWMLQRILSLIGIEDFAKIIYTYLLNLVSFLVSQLGFDFGKEMAKRLVGQLISYYPEVRDEIVQTKI